MTRRIWFLGLVALVLGAALALGAVSHDYLVGAKAKAIGDSQLGAFFIALAVALFGAFLLQLAANLSLRESIRAFERIHQNVKAGPLHAIKRLFEPVGLLGALAGLGLMLALVLKDYKPLLDFGIGPTQQLAIFGGSVLCIAGISFMATGNSFISHSMGPMVLQFEGLTQEDAKAEPVRKVRAVKRPAPDAEAPAAAVQAPTPSVPTVKSQSPVTHQWPAPEPAQMKPEIAPAPLPGPPAPEPEAIASAPVPDEVLSPEATAGWSDKKAEEAALEALKEAEAELGLRDIEVETSKPEPEVTVEAGPDMPSEPEAAPSAQEAVVEVFECPSCHGAVAESDTKCPNCGVSFDEQEETQVVAAIEEEAPPAPPEPAPAPLPPHLPPPLPPSRPKREWPEAEEPTEAPPAPDAEGTPAMVEEDEPNASGAPSILQSILDEISVREPDGPKAEESTPVEEDDASEVPKTCPNCGRKMKPRWKSCPYCGLEFR